MTCSSPLVDCQAIVCIWPHQPSTNHIENTMLVSFDIKFIRRDQKQRWNGEACRASPTFFLVKPDKLDIKKIFTSFSAYHASLAGLMVNRQ